MRLKVLKSNWTLFLFVIDFLYPIAKDSSIVPVLVWITLISFDRNVGGVEEIR